MTDIPVAISAPAVVSLVSRLERERVTVNQVRHLPIATARDARGGLRYGPIEIALVRLAVRLTRLYKREGWPVWKVRAALLYCGPLVRLGLENPAAYAVVVNPRDASVIVARVDAGVPAGVVIPLHSIAGTDDETGEPRTEAVNAALEA